MALRTPAFNDAKTYGFEWLRALLELDGQEGVVGAGDFKATAAAGGGMKLDIAAGVALVKGDSGVPGTGLSQGLFLEVNDAAVANAVTLNASDVTNPRVDQVVLRVRDSSDLGSGADDALFEVIAGVATAGATLDNRNGAAALPNDRMRIADVLVPAGSVAVTAGNVRDRRPWVRGARRRIVRAVADYTNAGAIAEVDTTNLKPRLECGGGVVRITIMARSLHTVASARAILAPYVDGALPDATDGTAFEDTDAPAATQTKQRVVIHETVPAAGSHLFSVAFATVTAGTFTLKASPTRPLVFSVEELVRQDAENT